MAEDDSGKLFPAVFYDGEREMSIGHVEIHPSLDFKTFQSIISQRIGISHNQLSIYLVDKRKPRLAYEDRRKILITGRVSFALMAKEKNCFILVVLKRSRRERRRKSKQMDSNNVDNFSLYNNSQLVNDFVLPNYYDPFGSVRDRLGELLIERENYMAAINNNNSNSNLVCLRRTEEVCGSLQSAGLKVCEVCRDANKERETAAFHCCINDDVTVGFRTSVGPISRPSR